MRARSSDFERMIASEEMRLSPSTLPAVSSFVVRSLTGTLRNLYFTRWPRAVEFPFILATSTIRRDSSYITKPMPGLVIHDDGLVDIVVAAAESILSIFKPVTAFTAYCFLTEQLVFRGRPELALFVCDMIYGKNIHSLFSEDSPLSKQYISEIRDFMKRDHDKQKQMRFFKGVCEAAFPPPESGFQEAASAYFLFHELGHYLYGLGVAHDWAMELGISLPAETTEEVCADLTSISCAVFSTRNDIFCTSPGHMTWVLGQVLAVAGIHRAFEEIRRAVRDVAQNWHDSTFRVRFPAADARFDATLGLATNRDFVAPLFRRCGSRAKINVDILIHFMQYSALIRHQLTTVSEFILTRTRELYSREEFKSVSAENLHFFDGYEASNAQDVISACNAAMGDDVILTLSPHSNQLQCSKGTFGIQPDEETTFIVERIGSGRHVNVSMEKRGINFLLDANDLARKLDR